MKQLSMYITAAFITIGIGLAGVSPASAQEGPCNGSSVIYNTGPDSNNQVACVSNDQIKVTCEDNVYVGTANVQAAESGNATGEGNTVVGKVKTGTAVNHNGTNVILGVTNCGNAEVPVTPGSGCTANCGGGGGVGSAGAPGGVGAVASAAPVAPVAPQAGGQGAFMLPNTATPSPITAAFTAIAAAIAIAVATRLGIAAYHRVNLK